DAAPDLRRRQPDAIERLAGRGAHLVRTTFTDGCLYAFRGLRELAAHRDELLVVLSARVGSFPRAGPAEEEKMAAPNVVSPGPRGPEARGPRRIVHGLHSLSLFPHVSDYLHHVPKHKWLTDDRNSGRSVFSRRGHNHHGHGRV